MFHILTMSLRLLPELAPARHPKGSGEYDAVKVGLPRSLRAPVIQRARSTPLPFVAYIKASSPLHLLFFFFSSLPAKYPVAQRVGSPLRIWVAPHSSVFVAALSRPLHITLGLQSWAVWGGIFDIHSPYGSIFFSFHCSFGLCLEFQGRDQARLSISQSALTMIH